MIVIARSMMGSLFHRIVKRLEDEPLYPSCQTACHRRIAAVDMREDSGDLGQWMLEPRDLCAKCFPLHRADKEIA